MSFWCLTKPSLVNIHRWRRVNEACKGPFVRVKYSFRQCYLSSLTFAATVGRISPLLIWLMSGWSTCLCAISRYHVLVRTMTSCKKTISALCDGLRHLMLLKQADIYIYIYIYIYTEVHALHKQLFYISRWNSHWIAEKAKAKLWIYVFIQNSQKIYKNTKTVDGS